MENVDLAIVGARVFTADERQPFADAIAVGQGRIVAVGNDTDILALADSGTRVLELSGETVLPGFQDAHLHFAESGLAQLRCDLYGTSTLDDHLEAVRRYAEAERATEWIDGGGWSMDDFGGRWPRREDLDLTVPDRPVYLDTRDGHSAWVNSRALELAGITRDTPDLPGGVIERDEGGGASGTLHETAMSLVSRLIPAPLPAEWARAIGNAQRQMHAFGITAVQEARIDRRLFEPYLATAHAGELTLRIEGCLQWRPDLGDEQLDELLEMRRLGTVGRLRLRGAKLFQDGVAENFTAAMLDCYRDASGALTSNAGFSLFEPTELDRVVKILDAHLFQVQVHTIGDRAVREALDAIECAVAANGPRDARHHLAHLQFVHPDDIPRFAALGVVGNVSPVWAVRSGYVEDLTLPFVSERAAALMYPFGSLQEAGARLAFGSDWSVSTPNPLLEIDVAVNRRTPGTTEEQLLPRERLDLETALRTFTMGSAFAESPRRRHGVAHAGQAGRPGRPRS